MMFFAYFPPTPETKRGIKDALMIWIANFFLLIFIIFPRLHMLQKALLGRRSLSTVEIFWGDS